MAFLVMDSHGPTVVVRLFYVLTGHMSGTKKKKKIDPGVSLWRRALYDATWKQKQTSAYHLLNDKMTPGSPPTTS